MRKPLAQSPLFDYEKAAAARKVKAEEKAAVGLRLNWTRKQAIMAWCHQCMNNQPAEVRRCADTTCPLWPFRHRKPVTAAEMKEFEEDFGNSADGKRFLKAALAGQEDGDVGEDSAVPDLPGEEEW